MHSAKSLEREVYNFREGGGDFVRRRESQRDLQERGTGRVEKERRRERLR